MMDFTFAAEHRLPYGKITGRTLSEVTSDCEGLDYLRDLRARLAPFKEEKRPELVEARAAISSGLAALSVATT